jgi:hypothetical protein
MGHSPGAFWNLVNFGFGVNENFGPAVVMKRSSRDLGVYDYPQISAVKSNKE